jgi:ATP-binding cassette, subfamily C, bacterial
VVVLDEPNSNLDAAGEQALTDTLLRAKQKGVTTVVITQRPALLSIVDKVLILRGGRAEAFGPPREVLRRALVSKPGAEQPTAAVAPISAAAGSAASRAEQVP